MKNVTKILTAVVLCAAVFASTERVNALGGNAAFWPGDEANISAFPAQINNHGYVQVHGMGSATAAVDMVFSHEGNTWGLGFSNADNLFNLGWGKDGMGISLAYEMQDDGAATGTFGAADYEANLGSSSGFMLGFGKDLGDMGEIGFHFTSGSDDNAQSADYAAAVANTSAWVESGTCACADDSDASAGTDQASCEAVVCTDNSNGVWTDTSACSNNGVGDAAGCDNSSAQVGSAASSTDWNTAAKHNGMVLDYRKSCGFWVFSDMVAKLSMPDDYNAGEMMLDVDWFGHMDAGVADVMLATGVHYNADGADLDLTANLGVEAAVTDNVTIRGGLKYGYDLSGDDEVTGNSHYAWATGAGLNFGSFTADVALTSAFWANPLGWIQGEDDDATWQSMTVTYNF